MKSKYGGLASALTSALQLTIDVALTSTLVKLEAQLVNVILNKSYD